MCLFFFSLSLTLSLTFFLCPFFMCVCVSLCVCMRLCVCLFWCVCLLVVLVWCGVCVCVCVWIRGQPVRREQKDTSKNKRKPLASKWQRKERERVGEKECSICTCNSVCVCERIF